MTSVSCRVWPSWQHKCDPYGPRGTLSLTCLCYTVSHLVELMAVVIRGSADKSLARPGKKQAKATNLGIFSTYSPRSSMHFLARCSTFCKPLKKNSESCPPSGISGHTSRRASAYPNLHEWWTQPTHVRCPIAQILI